MNDQTDTVSQTEDEILTDITSDEALEAAASRNAGCASFVMTCDCTRADCR